MASQRITVALLTRNSGPELALLLDRIGAQQPEAPEVLAIDSGSTDGTVELLRARSVRLLQISRSEFDHGLTRQLAIRQAGGEVIAFLSQDAMPANESWLGALASCFEDPAVAGAYSRQLPRRGASPFVRLRLSHWAAGKTDRNRQSLSDGESLDSLTPRERLDRIAFDNVSSAVRRSVALDIPFRESYFGEDLDWSRRVIPAGHAIVFEPASEVIHSHEPSFWYDLKRAYLDHQNLRRLIGLHTIPRHDDLEPCMRDAVAELEAVLDSDPRLTPRERAYWRRRSLLYALSQNVGQYLGAQSVVEIERGSTFYRLLDSLLGRRVLSSGAGTADDL